MNIKEIQSLREKAAQRAMSAQFVSLSVGEPYQTGCQWAAGSLISVSVADIMTLLDLAEAGLRAGEEVIGENTCSVARRDWVCAGAWLNPGDKIVVLRGGA